MTMSEYGHQHQELEPIGMLKAAVLISNKGTGSNLKAILDAVDSKRLPNVTVPLVLSDKPDAVGLSHAVEHQILYRICPFEKPTHVGEEGVKEARRFYGINLAGYLNQNGIDVAVMAGFGTILPQSFFDLFAGVAINLHPGYVPDKADEPGLYDDGTEIPWNKGMMTEKAVANFLGKPAAFSTVHVVTPETDFGPVLNRASTTVAKDDTVESLYARLKQEEHKAMIAALGGHKLRVELAERRTRKF